LAASLAFSNHIAILCRCCLTWLRTESPGCSDKPTGALSFLPPQLACRRFTRLTNGFSKKLVNHVAAVSLYVAHYKLCRVHEALKTTPAVALGIADRPWSIGDLLDAALAIEPPAPTETAPDRRRRFRVIEGGKQ
jgi:hypothetical protein